jgi:phosphoglycerate dehydrogenase-like enzyme
MQIYAAFKLKDEQLADLQAAGHTVVTPATFELHAAAKTVAIVYGWDQNARTLLAADNQVQWIQTISAGVDYLPLTALAGQNVQVTNTSGIHAQPIAESVLAYLLAFGRGLQASAQAESGQLWPTDAVRAQMFTLAGKTAVIFGTGHIGRTIAALLHGLGVQTLGVSRHGRPTEYFDEVTNDAGTQAVLARADFVINVMPLTAATESFFNAARFAQMTRQPLFVNVGRGPSVDEPALIAALDAGQLRGAGLDVFATEPLPADSVLLNHPRVIVTPHVSGTVEHLRQAVFAIFTENLRSFASDGKLVRNLVNLQAGY